jgi:hypothetical protein
MKVAVLLALLALAVFAMPCARAQENAVDPTRFAETESEDQQVLAAQADEFESALGDSLAASEEGEEESENDEEVEGEEEVEEEADEEADEDIEAEDEVEDTEADEEADEDSEEVEDESEETAEESSEEESEEQDGETEAESEGNPDYVLAELQDSPVSTGFMEMTSSFVASAPRAAEHLIHSLSSQQAAAAQQEYLTGYTHGHSDGLMVATHVGPAGPAAKATEEEEDSDEADSLMETKAKATANGAPINWSTFPAQPLYGAQYGAYAYAGAPMVPNAPYYSHEYHPSAVGAGHFVPPPPPLPTWLPPPPYVTPAKPAKEGAEEF